MSQQLISRNADLKQLRNEGYDIEIRDNHLLMKSVPYVNSKREVALGVLVSTLHMAGDVTAKPDTHVVYFIGEAPCNKDGTPLNSIINGSRANQLTPKIKIQHTFSSKPKDGYPNYYEKMKTYADILLSYAHAIDPSATPKTFPVYEAPEEESVFRYLDTASSRAGIANISSKLTFERIAIVGTGGTGSYVLDLIAKTPVKEIHIFDGDEFLSHNAFRAPGAASVEELRMKPKKVHYLAERYSAMRRGIIPHDVYIDEDNVKLLSDMNFVFLCMDGGAEKRLIVELLETTGIQFIDVGMGIEQVDDSLIGIIRVAASTPEKRDHVYAKKRIPFSGNKGDNDYESNIQVADLNALNAALAVIKWKKLSGFYMDLEHEHFCAYTIDGNNLVNEDQP